MFQLIFPLSKFQKIIFQYISGIKYQYMQTPWNRLRKWNMRVKGQQFELILENRMFNQMLPNRASWYIFLKIWRQGMSKKLVEFSLFMYAVLARRFSV